MAKFIKIGNHTVNLNHVVRTCYQPAKRLPGALVDQESKMLIVCSSMQGYTDSSSQSDRLEFFNVDADRLNEFFSGANDDVSDFEDWPVLKEE